MTKIRSSGYLKQVKPVLKKLVSVLLETYPYVSVLACDCSNRMYAISKSGINVMESDMLPGSGFCLKVLSDGRYYEYSFSTVSEEKIPEICKNVEGLVKSISLLPEGFSTGSYPALPDEAEAFEKSSECEKMPNEFPTKEIIESLEDIAKAGYAMSDKIISVNARYTWHIYHKLFISKNRELEQNVAISEGSIAAVAAKGEEMKAAYAGFSGRCGAELLEGMKAGLDKVVKDTIDLLDSQPMTPGEYDCVCTPEVTGIIAHEAFGHGVEMDMFVKDRALAKDYIGKRVASDLVTMHDGAAAADDTASFFFDDEGATAGDTIIIKNGILERGISDAQTAMVLGTPPTANGRRESYKRKAYTRMTNTYFEAGNSTYEEMIGSIDYGFLLDVPSSGMEDPKNWGIQCMVSIAREIKDGKLTGKIFSPVVLTGYVPDLLKSISMVSGEVKLFGSGFCGKGYKEWVKVSDGGPYIKARIRLG